MPRNSDFNSLIDSLSYVYAASAIIQPYNVGLMFQLKDFVKLYENIPKQIYKYLLVLNAKGSKRAMQLN